MARKASAPKDLLPLTHLSFLILLALAEGERHGYDIIQAVQSHWGSTFSPGTGTFYSALKRMRSEGLVETASPPVGATSADQRRRYYRMTDFGRSVLQAEAERLEEVVGAARSLLAVPGEGT
jgi:DNA-binding PadR family transcriptional regulator